MTRKFESKPAKRERVPLLIGLFGPAGSGKTYSALRLATGMQRITGGAIRVIDTEARRALHYADQFAFEHIQFDAPFSPLDYLDAIEFATKRCEDVLIIDSMSHEHEGPGGVLEWHAKEMDGDQRKQMLAWAKPKAARRKLINRIVQLGANAIFCFRAKEKLKMPERGATDREPKQLGWMPIGGEEFVFEMTASCLLLPASGGVPAWNSTMLGERAMTKLPCQFGEIFKQSQPLSEEIGEQLARWAAGDTVSGDVRVPGGDRAGKPELMDVAGNGSPPSQPPSLEPRSAPSAEVALPGEFPLTLPTEPLDELERKALTLAIRQRAAALGRPAKVVGAYVLRQLHVENPSEISRDLLSAAIDWVAKYE